MLTHDEQLQHCNGEWRNGVLLLKVIGVQSSGMEVRSIETRKLWLDASFATLAYWSTNSVSRAGMLFI